MLLTPSENWKIAATAAYRKITWTTEIRIVSSLSVPLFSGAWTRIDHMIKDISDRGQRIEFDPGQFTADSLQVTVYDIKWWQDNVFDVVAPGQYIELRRCPSIGIGDGAMSVDQVCVFSGFVDNTEGQLQYNYQANTIAFSVYTADDAGSRISALRVNTQYVNTNIDGAGTSGLILPRISGVFVKNANIAPPEFPGESYVLKAGMHELTYQYNGGTEQMKLDDGEFVTLPISDNTALLANGDNTQKIQVYVDVSELSNAEEIVDYVIVQNEGDVLPRQPYYGVSIGFLLRELYKNIGITNVITDTLQFGTLDDKKRYSFYDIPPQDISKTGRCYATANNGTDLFIAVGDSVYKRVMSTDQYQLITTKINYTVKRLWYNSTNNDVWVWFDGISDKYVRVYHLNTSSYNEFNVTSYPNYQAADLIYYNYGTGVVYGLVYVNKANAGDVRLINGSSFSDTQLFTANDFGYGGSGQGADSVYYVFVNSNVVYFYLSDDLGNYINPNLVEFGKISVDGSGSWVNDGAQFIIAIADIYYHASDLQQNARLHLDENRVYYVTDANPSVIKSHTVTSGTLTTVVTLPGGYRTDTLLYANGQIYAKVRPGISERESYLYSLDNNVATLLNNDSGIVQTFFQTMTYMGGVLYGVDYWKRLWRFSENINMYINNAVQTGTIKNAISELLTGYNLLGTISPHKKAGIYRRSDDDGNIQTSGNIIALNNSNIVRVNEIKNNYPKIGLVEVSNDKITHTYNGTSFDSQVFSDIKRFPVSNSLLPNDLIKDLAYYFYQFWNKSLKVYKVQTNIASMEYEIFDGADVDYQSEDQTINITNAIIIAASNDNFGNMVFEVLK